MIDLMRENPLLLLFAVTALGYGLGRVNILGIQFGAAAVLFVGIAFGALDPTLTIPTFVPQLGLVIFVYTVGLTSGALFFRTLDQQGNGYLRFIILSLTLYAALTALAYIPLSLNSPHIAGAYAGANTNTAALATILDNINTQNQTAMAVIGYSLAYPIGVIGRIILLTLMPRLLKVDFTQEAHDLRHIYPTDQEILNQVIKVTNLALIDRPLREIQRENNWNVIFGRFQRDGITSLLTGETLLKPNDLVIVAGEASAIDKVVSQLGQPANDTLLLDQTHYVKRRIFVSNHAVAGQPIAALDLKENYGALITRLRRGDTDILAHPSTILELGDRVRILARRHDMPAVVDLFGDSYVDVSRANLLPFSFGITIGLLLGALRIPITDTFTFQLGIAGGPLLIAVILGALRRTGRIVWTLPYAANQTLQQIGLILLLAGIGVTSGNTLTSINVDNSWWQLLLLGTWVVTVGMILSTLIGYRLLKIPYSLLSGMLASQPAVMNYMTEKIGNTLPAVGFAIAMPIGIILKVLFAQLLLALLT